MYLNKEILSLLTKELTCAIIHNPEKEHKKLMQANLKGMLILDVANKLQPFVISIQPRKSAFSEFFGKFKKIEILFKTMLIIALFFIMLIITENITINPPIERVVFMELSKAFFKLSPKFSVFDKKTILSFWFLVFEFFLFRKKPIIIGAK